MICECVLKLCMNLIHLPHFAQSCLWAKIPCLNTLDVQWDSVILKSKSLFDSVKPV